MANLKNNYCLAIVGGRRGRRDFNRVLDYYITTFRNGRLPDRVVSGGAKGVDTQAEAWARKHGCALTVFKPDPAITPFVKAAYARNIQIVDACDAVVALPCSNSKGTWHTVRYAKSKQCPVHVFVEEEEEETKTKTKK